MRKLHFKPGVSDLAVEFLTCSVYRSSLPPNSTVHATVWTFMLPPKCTCCNPNSQGDSTRRLSIWEIIRSWGQRCPYEIIWEHPSPLHRVRIWWEIGSLQPEEGSHQEPDHDRVGTQFSDFQPLELWVILLLISHPGNGILLEQPQWTMTVSQGVGTHNGRALP